MATEDFKRKLTAILSADVKGYSRLMGEDDQATVRTITAYREVITEVVEKHRGRVVDSPGDNILAEFASVIDAVGSAVEIQEELSAKNAELPEDRRMEFRIGVNLGDVIHEEERIYGDGVNVAARVESLAEAGGVCVSGTVFDQIESKLPLGYEYLGEQSVKNISKPVRIYKALMDPESVGKVLGEERVEPRRGHRVALAVLTVLLLIVGGLLIWRNAFPPVQVASVEKMAFPLPDRPSIAVLPFDNLSEDPKQEYFSDGLTEEIISALSSVPKLFVIARNSTFTYKGKPVKVQQVSEDLGVRYVLEGSVRKSGDTIHKRQHRRAKVSLPVTIKTEEETLERVTYDISPDGAFIRGLSPLELHEVIDMIISSPDRRIAVKARVVWSSTQVPPEQDMPRGMGVEFIKISDEDREFISSLVSDRDFAVYLKSAAPDEDEGPESLTAEQLVEEEKEDAYNPAQEPPKKCPRGHKHLSWSADEDYLVCWDCNKEYSLAECRDSEECQFPRWY